MEADKTYFNKETKIWYGPVEEPHAVTWDAMHRNPDHIMQICHQSGRQITNGEMAELSSRVAVHFRKLELQQIDVVGICAGNSDYIAPLFFGTMFSGLCLSTTDPSFNVKGLEHIYSLTRPKVMFCDGDIYDKVREALLRCGLQETHIYTVRKHRDGVPSILEFFDETNTDEEFRIPSLKHGGYQDAFYLCTSGSTDLPKVVRISHYALLNRVVPQNQGGGQKLLVCSGLYWFVGIGTLVQAAVHCETRVISENPFSPRDFYDIVKHHKITIVASSPSHIPLCLASPQALAASDLSSLRVLLATGKTLPYSLIAKFKAYTPNCRFPILYGMTEVCGAVTRTLIDPSNTVGVLLTNSEIKILDDRGEHLGPNETGEIYIL